MNQTPKVSSVQPRSVRFQVRREQEWRELDDIVNKAIDRGLRKLNSDELQKLPRLYRSVLSSLSVAQRTMMNRNTVNYLNYLAARAYLVMYGSRQVRANAVGHFVFQEFPRRVRSMMPELGLSTLFFFVGVIVAFFLVQAEAAWFYSFIPADYASGRDPTASTEMLRSTLYSSDSGMLATFASYLFTHNARIGMLAFALGFAAGVPTAILVFLNGLILGAFIALFAGRGLLWESLGWLLPHGVPEIAAVLLCAAAGFHIGKALVVPGKHRVMDALYLAGRRAAVVVGGAIALFAYAGLVEGIFRQTVQSDLLRYCMAAFNALWLSAWIFLAGRKKEEPL